MKLRNLLVMLLLLTGAVLFVACEGERGPAGKDGVDGKDGAKGEKGDPGPTGADGRVGDQGPAYGDSRCDVSNGIQGILGIEEDDLTGTDEADVICGTRVANTITAGGGDDTVYGAGGNDYLQGGDGDDEMNGGDGNDRFTGGDGDDTLSGGDGDDHFYLQGEGGANKLVGGDGYDAVYFGYANAATDAPVLGLYIARNSFADITFDLSTGSFDGSSVSTGATGTFTFEGIEDVVGNNGDDNITGNNEGNYLFGSNGSDTINGKAGDDTVLGGAGADTLNGGAGNDLLWGFNGADTLTGGTGADTFRIHKGQGVDVIKDFDLTEDKIYFVGFSKGDPGRAITVASGQILVGGTAVVEIHKNDSANNAEALKIKEASTSYRFVTKKGAEKKRKDTYTDN